MSSRKRRTLASLSRLFASKGDPPRINLRDAFKKSHHVPKVRANFIRVVTDGLKPTFSKSSLTLTPLGSRAVRGAARMSVAQKNIDIRKLPDTRPIRQRPVREQFKHTARERGNASNGHRR